jgi:branched-chain amino acid transport system substrate-binding protein
VFLYQRSLSLFLILAFVGSCQNRWKSCVAGEPIVLGAVYNLSGSQSDLDVPSLRGAQLAVAEVNQGGGVLERQIELVVVDGESNPTIVTSRTARFIEAHPSVSAILGLSDTDMVLAAAPVAARHGRVFLTSGATSPLLPGQVPDHLFLACFGDNVQASAAAEWAYRKKSARTVAILFDTSHSYTRLLQGYFRERFEELGGRVASLTGCTSGGLDAAVRQVAQADVVFLSLEAPEDIRAAIRQLRQAGVRAPIVGGDGFDAEDLWRESRDVQDVYFTTHAWLGSDNDDTRVVAFRKAYQQAYPDHEPDGFAALGYDAARLLLHAIERADSADPDAVREALAGIREFNGITGQLSYAAGSGIPRKSVSIIEVSGGELRLVEEVVPERIPEPDSIEVSVRRLRK